MELGGAFMMRHTTWGRETPLTDEEKTQLLILQEQEETGRRRNFGNRIESAIAQNYRGDHLTEIQLYKEAIKRYITSSISPNALKTAGDGWYGLDDFIDIYCRYLKGEKITTEEYCYFQSVIIKTDEQRIMLKNEGINLSTGLNNQYFREISQILKNRYYEFIDLFNEIERMLGMPHDTIINLIRAGKSESIEELKSKLGKDDKIKNLLKEYGLINDLGTSPSVVICSAIDTIIRLREQPQVMGLSHDDLSLKMDKILALRRKKYSY